MKNLIAADNVYDGHNPLLSELGQKHGKIIRFGRITPNPHESQLHL